jgi:SAM-dependent methyltransferase
MIKPPSGSAGWDDYADFYDWENAQTMARRDVPFWQRLALAAEGPVLELGCGTGRVTLPLARAGVKVVGVDLSAPMLKRARDRVRRTPLGRPRATCPRRHPRAAVSSESVPARRGALRHPAVIAARGRSQRHAARRA